MQVEALRENAINDLVKQDDPQPVNRVTVRDQWGTSVSLPDYRSSDRGMFVDEEGNPATIINGRIVTDDPCE